jgi:hypothetical protein
MFAELSLNPTLRRQTGYMAAVRAFHAALFAGTRGQWLGKLTGRSQALRTLPARNGEGHYLGARVVALSDIVGTENRAQDFDRNFRPLNANTQERWMSVYRARARGLALPPVALVKRGTEYYVRDGHHRLSVARALGQVEVEAVVIEVKA